ncbi:MAG: TspO/MBR family protein [Chlorobiaceae bacterium]
MKLNIPKLATCIGICFAAAYAGSFFTPLPGSEWYYHTLNKPSWNPPSWLFAPAWSILFLLMAIALYQVIREGLDKKPVQGAVRVFAIQLFLNFSWSALFFGLKSPLYGLIEIVFLWSAIVLTIVKFKAVKPLAAYLLIPYLMWVSFASFLNFTIWTLN